MKVSVISIDLAKEKFQVAAFGPKLRTRFNRQVGVHRLAELMAQQAPTLVAMEACASAHFWGRKFEAMGHEVRLIPPQHVRPFRAKNKTDARDAVAIAEAALRPNIHWVPIKSSELQDVQLLNRERESLIKDRNRLICRVRGWVLERGVRIGKGVESFLRQVPRILEDADNGLTAITRRTVWRHYERIQALHQQAEQIKSELREHLKDREDYRLLRSIDGFGPVVAATFLGAVGSGQQFRRGRNCAAWAGLTPRLDGTGGVTRTLGITKHGDRYLRTQLIHGARAMYWAAHRRNDALSRWVLAIAARRGAARAIVALANKMARIGWAVLTSRQPYDMNKAFAS